MSQSTVSLETVSAQIATVIDDQKMADQIKSVNATLIVIVSVWITGWMFLTWFINTPLLLQIVVLANAIPCFLFLLIVVMGRENMVEKMFDSDSEKTGTVRSLIFMFFLAPTACFFIYSFGRIIQKQKAKMILNDSRARLFFRYLKMVELARERFVKIPSASRDTVRKEIVDLEKDLDVFVKKTGPLGQGTTKAFWPESGDLLQRIEQIIQTLESVDSI